MAEKSAGLFIETKYQHHQNKQWYKEYLLTIDGFTLVAMGFTGAKALQWKLKYIEALIALVTSEEEKVVHTLEVIQTLYSLQKMLQNGLNMIKVNQLD